MTDLTPRQAQVLHFLRDFNTEYGFPPTRVEIARALGFKSPNASEEHLRALERKGEIFIAANTARGISFSAPEPKACVCPSCAHRFVPWQPAAPITPWEKAA